MEEFRFSFLVLALLVFLYMAYRLSSPKCSVCKAGRLKSTFKGDGVEYFRCNNCGKREWKVD